MQCRCEFKQQAVWPAGAPLVTVVVPCYNYGLYVASAIESVLDQSFQRLEIIVIDDGSTDEYTRQVLDALDYPRTRVVRQANCGLAETRNIGARLAAGKYVCYLDADDALERTYLAKTVEVLEQDESIGCCYSWVQCFGNATGIWETRDLDPFFLRECTTAPSHSVIRKAAWDDVVARNGSGFLSKYDGFFEDWVFWIDLVQRGYRGKAIREPLIYYRIHANSLGARHRPRFDEMLRVLRADRSDFFCNSSYRRTLARMLNRRIYIENNRVNIDAGRPRDIDPRAPTRESIGTA